MMSFSLKEPLHKTSRESGAKGKRVLIEDWKISVEILTVRSHCILFEHWK